MVRFQNVGMRYGLGPEILHDITFGLSPGSFHFMKGPSGAGKATQLRRMYLAFRPTRGLINLFERDTTTMRRKDLPALRRRIGVVFQDFRLINHLSALDNVALPLRIAGAKKEQVTAHVSELLSWVGLKDQIHARPPTLSDGEKQRVAIARAVISRPSLLLADEPTGSVDHEQGLRILHLFEELNKIGTTVVIASHDRELIARFGRPELRLIDGTLKVHAPPRVVQPAAPVAARAGGI